MNNNDTHLLHPYWVTEIGWDIYHSLFSHNIHNQPGREVQIPRFRKIWWFALVGERSWNSKLLLSASFFSRFYSPRPLCSLNLYCHHFCFTFSPCFARVFFSFLFHIHATLFEILTTVCTLFFRLFIFILNGQRKVVYTYV